jgi:hypothetical protein
MMEAVRTSETSVDNNLTRQYNPEDSSEQQLFGLLDYSKLIVRRVRLKKLSNAAETGIQIVIWRRVRKEEN